VGQRNKACGVDVHKNTIMATILSQDGTKIQEDFQTTISELLRFREWLIDNSCEVVAMESTGTYWIPVYSVLEGSFEVIVANPYMVKHIPGRKTDVLDSEWLAVLCLKDLIKRSRIFLKEDRELRRLTRSYEALVKIRTQLKNEIHRELASSHIKLSSVVADIFGKSGIHILKGLLDGQAIDDIIKGIPSGRVRKKGGQIKEAIHNNLEITQILLIESSLDLIAKIREKIDEIRNEIEARIKFRQDDLEIAISVPGIDFLSASTILAEIGDYRDFNTPEQLASYFGLVPFVNQSGTKQRNGCITKHGSKHLRRILVQVAHAASKKIGSKLRKFYLRIRAKKGANVAIIALARKILCILHHLLTKGELYEEDGIERSKPITLDRTSSPREMTVQEMIDVIRQSGYTITKIDQGACG